MRTPLRRSEPARKRAPAGRRSTTCTAVNAPVSLVFSQRERVLHEVAGGGDLLTRALAQQQRVAGRIERHVDRNGRRRA